MNPKHGSMNPKQGSMNPKQGPMNPHTREFYETPIRVHNFNCKSRCGKNEQVIRDHSVREEGRASENKAAATDAWRVKARAFLRKKSQDDAADTSNASPKKKKQRLASYDHIISMDHMLTAFTGNGLAQFKTQAWHEYTEYMVLLRLWLVHARFGLAR